VIPALLARALRRSISRVFGSEERLRDSGLYDAYLRLRYPSHVAIKDTERRFYAKLLGGRRAELIFDIGANNGAKAAIFTRLAERVVCVEPSPDAVAALKRRFTRTEQVTVVAAGAGDRCSTQLLSIFEQEPAYNTFSKKWLERLGTPSAAGAASPCVPSMTLEVPVTTLDALIQRHGAPCNIKVDVEGNEWPVMQGLGHATHLFSFECNLPEFEEESLSVIERLELLNPGARFNFVVTEPPLSFQSEDWIGAQELADVVRSRQWPFMEIFCRGEAPCRWAGEASPPASRSTRDEAGATPR
jgi:FkbM family methyltransferase